MAYDVTIVQKTKLKETSMETYNNGISMQKHTRSQDKESADIIFEHRKFYFNK